jgi:sortase A
MGALVLAYAATVFLWRDPATDLWARYQQHQLAGQLEQLNAVYGGSETVALAPRPLARPRGVPVVVPQRQHPARKPVTTRAEKVGAARGAVAKAATRLQADVQQGQALGRIRVPRLGIDPVFVHGTRWAQDLSKGPGHYERTSMPGLDKTVAIAGHRTTFGAPFRHIDSLEPGDRIVLQMPYGTFRYAVFGHRIVANDDWSIIRERGFDTLVLSACHPLYSAKQRYVVFARLVRVDRPGGFSYAVPRREGSAAA